MQRRCSMSAASNPMGNDEMFTNTNMDILSKLKDNHRESDVKQPEILIEEDTDESSVDRLSSTPSDLERKSKLQDPFEVESPYALHGIKLIPEGEWGWAVCFSGFVVQFIVLGINNSFGILFAFLLNEFDKSKGATAWVGSAAIGVLYIFGPITCGLNERIGFRTIAFIGGVLCGLGMLLTSFVTEFYKIFVTYSLLWGIGSSLCYFSTLTVAGDYFCRKLSLVNGIITAGSGFGTMTFGPLLQFLLKKYGLTVTLRILSAITILLVVASLTYKRFRSPLEQIYNIKRTPAPFCDVRVWKNKAFVLYTAAVSLFMLGYFIPYVHMVSLVVDTGISPSDGAMLIGYMSISSTLSRIVFGRFSDHPRVNRLYMTQFAIVGFGAMTFLCPLVKTYRAFVAVMVMLGLFDGMYVVLIAVVVTDIVGVHKLNQALGNLYGVISFAVTAGPPFAGFIYDALLSYNTAFYLCGATTILSSLLMFPIPWLIRKENGRRFERDSIDSRLDSLLSFSRSMTNGLNSNCRVNKNSGERVTKSGLGGNKCKRMAPKRKLVREQSTIYSEKELSICNDDDMRTSNQDYEGCRERSISFPSDKDDQEGEDTFFYEPSYEYGGVFDSANFSDSSSSSSGCILSNSFNTSQNTSYNSSMSNRGSITKVLLSRQLSGNGSPTRSPKLSKLKTSVITSIPKTVEGTSVSKETVV